MNTYSPQVKHYFTSSIQFFIGEVALHNGWVVFGWAMYALGFVAAAMITYAFIKEVRYVNRDESMLDEEPAEEVREEPGAVSTDAVTDGSTTKIFHLPASERQLEQLALGLVVAGDSFSEKKWSGTGRPFSVNQFRLLREEMIGRGLAHMINEKDPRQGYGLTRVGLQVLRKHLPHSPIVADITPVSGSV